MKTLQEESYLALIAVGIREAVCSCSGLLSRQVETGEMNHNAIRLMMAIMQHNTQIISLFDSLC